MVKKRIIYTIAVTLIIVFSTTYSILMTLERNDYRNYLQGEYTKNMYELITNITNIRINLGKAAIAGSREQSIVVFEDIFRNSSMANTELYSLPLSSEVTSSTGKFISQIGNFCYSLSLAASEGRDLSDKNYDSIETLKKESLDLENELKKVSEDISSGKIKWGEIRKKASGILSKDSKGDKELIEKFTSIQKQIAEYPALIYDGPFSDNVQEIKPRIYDEKIISEKNAEDVAKSIVGRDRVNSIEYKKDEGKTKIESYRFYINIKGRKDNNSRIICEISKNGGKVVYLVDERSIGSSSIDPAKAIDIGSKYLEKAGYKNMISTYVMNYGNSIVVNYVYKEGDVIIYPDQIKLKIALDDGSIVGIESEKYLVSHTDKRNLIKPKITSEEAKKRVGKKLQINSVRLTVIPTETNKEVLCYEFSGVYKEDSFKVYINAENGYEQKIIQIINTADGQLTI